MYKYIIIFLCFVTGFFVARYNVAQFKISKLESEISSLKTDISTCKVNLNECNEGIKEFNDAQIRASDTIQKIKTVVKTVKSDCDCFNVSLEPAMLAIVRKQK